MFIVIRNPYTLCGEKECTAFVFNIYGTYTEHFALKDSESQLCVLMGGFVKVTHA